MSAPQPVVLVLDGAERAEVCEMLGTAEIALAYGPTKAQHDALRDLVDYLSDLQIGSETSDFVFPLPEPRKQAM